MSLPLGTGVSFLMLCVVTLGGLAWYVMEPDERKHALRVVIARLRQAQDGAKRLRQDREPLHDVLRARTPIALVTPLLVAANVAVFAAMLAGAAPSSDAATLVSWGANFGPQTTNGEWWRLVTSSFVHSGVLHLAVNLAALISVGLVLERLVGHLTFAAVYAASAVFAGVAALSTAPVTVIAGGSGAIFGLYGLLLASWTWGACQHATTTIRVHTVNRLAPAALVFVLYHIADGGIASPGERLGLVTGFVCGLALARCVRESKPPARRIAATIAATASIAILSAVPLRGVVDIRPEVNQLAALEERLAGTYDEAVGEFRKGRLTGKALVQVIEGTVLPELQKPRQRLKAFDKVPPEHDSMRAAAETYLRLRDESWRLRAAALRRSSMPMLRQADEVEKASLEALRMIGR